MVKEEFREKLKGHNISCTVFADLIGRDRDTVYKFGESTPVPYYVRVILRLIDERGGIQGLTKAKLR